MGHVGDEENAAREGAPHERAQAVREGEEQALAQEPVLVGLDGVLEGREAARADGAREGQEHRREGVRLGALEERRRGEPPQEHVARDQVRQDERAVLLEARRRLQVRFLQAARRPPVVVVDEVEPPQVVQVRDALRGRVERQRRRVLCNLSKHLRGYLRLAALFRLLLKG